MNKANWPGKYENIEIYYNFYLLQEAQNLLLFASGGSRRKEPKVQRVLKGKSSQHWVYPVHFVSYIGIFHGKGG